MYFTRRYTVTAVCLQMLFQGNSVLVADLLYLIPFLEAVSMRKEVALHLKTSLE
jgi:hypothetical protein